MADAQSILETFKIQEYCVWARFAGLKIYRSKNSYIYV